MTPKEQAISLYDKFHKLCGSYVDEDYFLDLQAQDCAFLCASEIRESLIHPEQTNPVNRIHIDTLKYWEEVKKEIENL